MESEKHLTGSLHSGDFLTVECWSQTPPVRSFKFVPVLVEAKTELEVHKRSKSGSKSIN